MSYSDSSKIRWHLMALFNAAKKKRNNHCPFSSRSRNPTRIIGPLLRRITVSRKKRETIAPERAPWRSFREKNGFRAERTPVSALRKDFYRFAYQPARLLVASSLLATKGLPSSGILAGHALAFFSRGNHAVFHVVIFLGYCVGGGIVIVSSTLKLSR
ncbi:uncharacterized protein LOC143148514 [Ptiloglossa arizonensis]|uniref:uncharacterized protein LOC143148514 n=1 Tax=Ptiloglossa arizonensis TaxID=3350558 RepID=UPI003F9F1416